MRPSEVLCCNILYPVMSFHMIPCSHTLLCKKIVFWRSIKDNKISVIDVKTSGMHPILSRFVDSQSV